MFDFLQIIIHNVITINAIIHFNIMDKLIISIVFFDAMTIMVEPYATMLRN